MTKVEQIVKNKITLDFDIKLTKCQITDELKKDFGVTNSNNPFVCKINNTEIKLFVKQITYLGNPHAIFKKRIQIAVGWSEELKKENSFLLGLYKFNQTVIYTIFDKKNYIDRVSNNSSAHVYTLDLLKAQEQNVFSKKDNFGNIITSVKREFIVNTIRKLIKKEEVLTKEVVLFNDFKNTLKAKYYGKDCYSEMIKDNYKNKFQPEWVGFYLEYKFQNFLNKNPNLKLICNYQSNKKKGEIDLDLNFNNNYYGDLKAHSNESSAILGNDKNNVQTAIHLHNKIWYIVFNHNTEKDSENNFEVTKFWNEQQKKSDLMSYSIKMKNNILFTDFKILEINKYNQQYLSDFNQGKNTNGLPRETKIKIDKKNINNFLIYNSTF